jgi:protein ImuB
MRESPRLASLLLRDLALVAAQRVEPELCGQAVAIADGDRIVAGLLRGLRVSQARAVQPGIQVRGIDLESIRAAQEALLDVAFSVSPRVQQGAPGELFVDLAGIQALHPSDASVLTALRVRLERVGLGSARLGIGPTCTVAALAARWRDGEHCVQPHRVREFLRPLPLDLLEPADALADRLTRWGVRTLGELTVLPSSALGVRLGPPGLDLLRRARGEDAGPFQPMAPPLTLAESAESETPIENLEALAFLLRPVLDRLVQRLAVRGLCVRELSAELLCEGGERAVRRIASAAPTAEVATLLALVRLALERDPPRAAVERVRVTAAPGHVESAQLDLFLPPLPAPAELALVMAQLEMLCGPGRVGAPQLEDTHRPDAARVGSFRLPAALARGRRSARSDPPPMPRPVAPITLALRAVRPPRRIAVQLVSGAPAQIDLPPLLRVTRRAGPWRLFGEWWGESCFARDYFDLELSNGGLYRVYQNLDRGHWFLDGIYD